MLMLHHLLQQSGADLGFHTPSPANSARCLGSALLSEKKWRRGPQNSIMFKRKKNLMSKKSVWCAFKSRDGFKKKIYFEGDFFIVWCYFYIYAVKLQDTMYNTLLNAEQVLVVVFIWYLCFNLIFQCIYTCTYFFRPLARLYCVILYFLQTRKSQRNQCSKRPFHFCAIS